MSGTTARRGPRRRLPLALAASGLVVASTLVFAAFGPASAARSTAAASAPARETAGNDKAREAYAKLPLSFVPNAGQLDRRVRYSAQAGGASFYFTEREAVFSFAKQERGLALRLGFVGASATAPLGARTRAAGRVNYLLGDDPAKWRTNLPTYQELVYRDLWPGIDLAFRGERGKLKYEFRLEPGASVRAIRLAYGGVQGLALDRSGNLQLDTALGGLEDSRPLSYQQIGGRRVPVESRFALGSGSVYGFVLGDYDRRHPLVIDPGLVYSTYLGGSDFDEGRGIAVDAFGSAYVTGRTDSANFPTTLGAFDTTANGTDAFVTKLNATGSALAYSTYLGGSGTDSGSGIAVASGSAYVTGRTGSGNFPTTLGAFDTSANGVSDAFVTKLNPTGSALAYSTYLGGSNFDEGLGIAVDAFGSAYVTGQILSGDFPTTLGAFDTSANGGTDAVVAKLNPTGSALAYSTYLGGSAADLGFGIAVDAFGSAYVTGTGSGNFPTTPGAFDTTANGADAVVTKLNPAGSALAYSTYLGGSGFDSGSGIAVDAFGSAYVTGPTSSGNFPTTPGAFDTTANFGDAFVTKLNPAGSALVNSTYLGGSNNDEGRGIAVDAADSAYVTGFTNSVDFPTTLGAFDTMANGGSDAFVTKLEAPPSPCPPEDDDLDDDGLDDELEDLFDTLLGDPDSDDDGVPDGNEDSDDDGEDDEDEDDDTDPCPDDSDGDGEDDEDEDD